mmetsp:Transcript_28787/g.82749  ORF Transcript_28787/g.82749 Transcript_28787/m.82749 type:complete len:274 (-) Transcript_28787:1056-1877(-)
MSATDVPVAVVVVVVVPSARIPVRLPTSTSPVEASSRPTVSLRSTLMSSFISSVRSEVVTLESIFAWLILELPRTVAVRIRLPEERPTCTWSVETPSWSAKAACVTSSTSDCVSSLTLWKLMFATVRLTVQSLNEHVSVFGRQPGAGLFRAEGQVLLSGQHWSPKHLILVELGQKTYSSMAQLDPPGRKASHSMTCGPQPSTCRTVADGHVVLSGQHWSPVHMTSEKGHRTSSPSRQVLSLGGRAVQSNFLRLQSQAWSNGEDGHEPWSGQHC